MDRGTEVPETGAYTISEGQITRASRSGGVVTLTTAAASIPLSVGDRVTVMVSFNVYFAGTFVVTARTDTTFSYLVVGDDFPDQEVPGVNDRH